jgi:hypothetical protein
MPADPAFETPDAAPSIAPLDADGDGPSYLDRGRSLALHAAPARIGRLLRRFRMEQRHVLPAQPASALEIGDVVGAVFSGMIPSSDAGAVAEERCLATGDDLPTARWSAPPAPPATEPIPAYLAGRFGPAPVTWVIAADDKRAFAAGALLYPNSDASRPDTAIGVVLGPRGHGEADALVGPDRGRGDWIFVRDLSSAVPVQLVGRVFDMNREAAEASAAEASADAAERQQGPLAAS